MKKWIFLALFLLAFASTGCPQASVSLSPVAKQQFFSATGIPLAGGKLYTYKAGTTTPQATYVDATGTAVNTNPIILDSGGFANIWLVNNQQYKFILYDASNVLQWSVDNFSVGGGGGGGGNCPPSTIPDTSVLFVHPLGSCDGVTKFKTNENGEVDINTGGTFQVESVTDPTHNFVFTQGHQFFVKSNSANYDGSTNDGYTGYVDDSATPATSSGSLVGTSVTVSSGTLSVSATGADSTFDFPGEYAVFSSCVSASFLNGQTVQIANASGSALSAVGTAFSDYGPTADNCTIKRQSSSNPVPFYSSGAAQYGGILTSFDSETGGENPQAYSLTDFLAGAYGDGPEYGYGFHARVHDLVQVESAQLIADSDGGGQDDHSYALKVGSPNQTPYWWVGLDGSSLSRSGFANVASASVGSCNLSVGLNDCTASLIDDVVGPPSSETLTIKICATGTVYDTMDWTENGTAPTCASQHMLRTVSGTLVADGIQLNWGAQTGHTVGALAAIPVTVNYGSQLRTLGGSYLYSTALAQPSQPIVTPATSGVNTWSYCVVQKWNGIGTDCSPVGSATSVSTLNSTDHIQVSLNNGVGNPVIQCDLYRTASGGTPSTTGVIASDLSCDAQVIDSGLSADSTAAPSVNNTGHTVLSDGYLLYGRSASHFTLPQITGSGCIGISSGVVSNTATGCSGGGGGVSSVGLVGTANQITVTGSSPITSSGSWTLSIPNNPTLPGNTTGTFIGNITGNVTGNTSGTAATITGQVALANLSSLTTDQDLLMRNGSSLGHLPISTVTSGQCLGNNSGTWSTFACSGGSGSGINITVNGGSALGGPANFQNGTSGNIVNFSNPSGSVVQATLQSNSVTSGMLASGLTLGGTTTGTFSGNLAGNVTGNATGYAASIGNGTTVIDASKTSTIQDALDLCSASKPVVIIPPGVYTLPAGLTSSCSGIDIEGYGGTGDELSAGSPSTMHAATILVVPSGAWGFTFNGSPSSTLFSGPTIRNVCFVGASGALGGIDLIQTNNFTIDHVCASYFTTGTGILSDGTNGLNQYGVIKNSTIVGNKYDIESIQNSGLRVLHNHLDNAHNSGSPAANTKGIYNACPTVTGGFQNETSIYTDNVIVGSDILIDAECGTNDVFANNRYEGFITAAVRLQHLNSNFALGQQVVGGSIVNTINGSVGTGIIVSSGVQQAQIDFPDIYGVATTYTDAGTRTNIDINGSLTRQGVNVQGISASQLVKTDASKNLASLGTPSQCSGTQFAQGINSSGGANCAGIANTTVAVTGATQGAFSCSSPVSVTMTGLLTSSVLEYNYSANPALLTGWGSTGGVKFNMWPSASNTAQWSVCNQTSAPLTYSSITFNVGAR